MLQVLAGHHRNDPDSSQLPVLDYLAELTANLAGVKLGVAQTTTTPHRRTPGSRRVSRPPSRRSRVSGHHPPR